MRFDELGVNVQCKDSELSFFVQLTNEHYNIAYARISVIFLLTPTAHSIRELFTSGVAINSKVELSPKTTIPPLHCS